MNYIHRHYLIFSTFGHLANGARPFGCKEVILQDLDSACVWHYIILKMLLRSPFFNNSERLEPLG